MGEHQSFLGRPPSELDFCPWLPLGVHQEIWHCDPWAVGPREETPGPARGGRQRTRPTVPSSWPCPAWASTSRPREAARRGERLRRGPRPTREGRLCAQDSLAAARRVPAPPSVPPGPSPVLCWRFPPPPVLCPLQGPHPSLRDTAALGL